MGLFSSEKRTYVSSQAYNMAGPNIDRVAYLKSTAIRAILSGDKNASVGMSIVQGQLSGPVFDQRRFFRWAATNFTEGLLSGELTNMRMLDASNSPAIKAAIPKGAGQEVLILEAKIDAADIAYWAEQYIYTNFRSLILTNWVCDYLEDTGQMKIVWEDTTETLVTLTGFDPRKDYIFATYMLITPDSADPVVTGNLVSGLASRPDLSFADPAWVQVSYTPTNVTVDLNETVVVTTTVGEDPPTDETTVTPSQVTFEEHYEILEREVLVENNGPNLKFDHQTMNIWRKYEIVETVVTDTVYDESTDTTTVTKTTTESVVEVWEYRTDAQNIYKENVLNSKNVFIYELGAGNAALDALQTVSNNYVEFFPVIPIRRHNKAIDHADYAEVYPSVRKAYKKIIGTGIDKILRDIEDNPDIAQIDHCFLIFGCNINALDNESLQYNYEFFREMMGDQIGTTADVEAWANNQTFAEFQAEYQAWLADRNNEFGAGDLAEAPTWSPRPLPNYSKLRLKAEFTGTGFNIPYDVEINWRAIGETIGTGLGKPDAKVGDLWWEVQPDIPDPTYVPPIQREYWTGTREYDLEHVRLFWQKTPTTHTYLDIYGMEHTNRVYDGKSVLITAKEGINSNDDSGFVIPLHYETLKKLPIVKANELSQNNRILVFNTYEVQIIQWWQKGVFAVIFAIVITVISALVFPGGIGLLGAHAAVGASLGFTGITAVIAGAVANAIAAIILTSTISYAAKEAFGEEWGPLIGAIVSFFVGAMAVNYHVSGSFSINWGEFLRIDNLLKLTNAVSNGVGQMAQAKVANIREQMEELGEQFEEDSRWLQELWEELGYSNVYLDPLLFKELSDTNLSAAMVPESADTFIQRTTLVGSELASLSHQGIYNFTELGLTLPEPIV